MALTEEEKKYQRDYYAKYPEYFIKKTRDRRRELNQFVLEIKKKGKCSKCGNNDYRVLDFHHPRNDKIDGISNLIRRGWSKKRIQIEISKCILLCKNCHAILHWKEIGEVV